MKYNTRSEFARNNEHCYFEARKNKTNFKTICEHMKGNRTWTDKRVKQEALKYETRLAFQKGCKGAYNYTLRKGGTFTDMICSHMKKRFVWTIELITQEASKYKTKNEFRNQSRNAYSRALRTKIIDQLFPKTTTGKNT